MSILYTAQQLTIYGGFFLLINGIIGNGFNIFIFLVERNYRQIPSIFFFLIGSIVNTMHLLFNLGLRILSGGFGIDLTAKTVVLCKLRSSLLAAFGFISLTCICLASVDQFLATSRHQLIRKYSNIKWAHCIMLIMTLIWFGHSIPYAIFNTIINGLCVQTNIIYKDYTTYSLFVFFIGLPILVLTIFGYLSYRNIHRIRILVNQQADRQITRMTLMQTIVVCLSILPYGILSIYALVTNGTIKSLDQQMKEYFASAIINLISYIHFSVSVLMLNST